jgi:hypothetical protein
MHHRRHYTQGDTTPILLSCPQYLTQTQTAEAKVDAYLATCVVSRPVGLKRKASTIEETDDEGIAQLSKKLKEHSVGGYVQGTFYEKMTEA